jgi:hypothetical protein
MKIIFLFGPAVQLNGRLKRTNVIVMNSVKLKTLLFADCQGL